MALATQFITFFIQLVVMFFFWKKAFFKALATQFIASHFWEKTLVLLVGFFVFLVLGPFSPFSPFGPLGPVRRFVVFTYTCGKGFP